MHLGKRVRERTTAVSTKYMCVLMKKDAVAIAESSVNNLSDK